MSAQNKVKTRKDGKPDGRSKTGDKNLSKAREIKKKQIELGKMLMFKREQNNKEIEGSSSDEEIEVQETEIEKMRRLLGEEFEILSESEPEPEPEPKKKKKKKKPPTPEESEESEESEEPTPPPSPKKKKKKKKPTPEESEESEEEIIPKKKTLKQIQEEAFLKSFQ